MYLKKFCLSAVAVTALSLSLTACGGDDEPTAPEAPSSSSTPSESPTESEQPASEEPSAPSEGTTPAWAVPAAVEGEKLTSVELDGKVTVDIYQVGTARATKDGMFVDPDTNKSLVQKGDELVIVNYVVTNTGAESVSLANLLVDVTARYDDWKWLQGMDGDITDSLFEDAGVHKDALDYGSDAALEAPYEFKPGESFSFAENFKYQKGSPITFDVSLVPADEAGELDHDSRVEAEAKAEIK